MASSERSAGVGQKAENQHLVEHADLSPGDLKDDNRNSQDAVRSWKERYEKGQLYLEIDCSDARVVTDGQRVVEQSSVAAGFPHRPHYARLYNGPEYIALVVKTHHKGFVRGQRLSGCGGQDTKEAIRNGNIRTSVGITEYVDANVDEDPLLQGIRQAKATARVLKRDGKILVATQDHVRAETIPVAEFTYRRGVDSAKTPRELRDVLDARNDKERQDRYRPDLIYAQRIPDIPISELTDESASYIVDLSTGVMNKTHEDPEFEERQQTQDPFAVAIYDGKTPLTETYRRHFGRPGTVFRVHIPRSGDQEMVDFEPRTIGTTIDQIHYPILNSIDNHGTPGAPFSSTRLVLIETVDLKKSQQIAEELLREEWMRRWHKELGHLIFISESRSGNTIQMKEFPKAA